MDLFQVPHTLQWDVPFLEILDDRGGECCLGSTMVAGSISLQVACHSSKSRCIGIHPKGVPQHLRSVALSNCRYRFRAAPLVKGIICYNFMIWVTKSKNPAELFPVEYVQGCRVALLFTVNEVAMIMDVHVSCAHMQMYMWMRVLCVVLMGVCMCICLCCSVLCRLWEVAVTLGNQQWPVLAKDKLLEGEPEPPEPPQLLV